MVGAGRTVGRNVGGRSSAGCLGSVDNVVGVGNVGGVGNGLRAGTTGSMGTWVSALCIPLHLERHVIPLQLVRAERESQSRKKSMASVGSPVQRAVLCRGRPIWESG